MTDLRAGRLRFVGDPAAHLRVAEDYLRVLRFFRFFARYGRAEPDAATLVALRDGVPHLARHFRPNVYGRNFDPHPGRAGPFGGIRLH